MSPSVKQYVHLSGCAVMSRPYQAAGLSIGTGGRAVDSSAWDSSAAAMFALTARTLPLSAARVSCLPRVALLVAGEARPALASPFVTIVLSFCHIFQERPLASAVAAHFDGRATERKRLGGVD